MQLHRTAPESSAPLSEQDLQSTLSAFAHDTLYYCVHPSHLIPSHASRGSDLLVGHSWYVSRYGCICVSFTEAQQHTAPPGYFLLYIHMHISIQTYIHAHTHIHLLQLLQSHATYYQPHPSSSSREVILPLQACAAPWPRNKRGFRPSALTSLACKTCLSSLPSPSSRFFTLSSSFVLLDSS